MKNLYYNNNGKHQEEANILFREITPHGRIYNYKNESKLLRKLAKLLWFYKETHYYLKMYDFNTAVNHAKKKTFYTIGFKAESVLQLEKMMDDLIIETYNEQKSLWKIACIVKNKDLVKFGKIGYIVKNKKI